MKPIFPTGNKGFTLLEVLVTVLVFTLGFSQLFMIYFESASAVRHVGNRLAAVVFMENAAWEAEKTRSMTAVKEGYRYEKTETNGSDEIFITAEAKKIEGFKKLYKLEVKAAWSEGKKSVTMRRERFIRKK
jgi:prepilin-type N-terminal cleavage/methylation domain-containing protein